MLKFFSQINISTNLDEQSEKNIGFNIEMGVNIKTEPDTKVFLLDQKFRLHVRVGQKTLNDNLNCPHPGFGTFSYSSFWPQIKFVGISKMVGCIPEVLTLLLTPILTYICMSYAICHVCHICQICHI